jgi:uncharacterized protein (TIGR03083 family)
MDPLDAPDYLRHLRSESARFREVLVACAPDAQVPGCPAWRAADLLWHLTEVHHFWGWVITHRPESPKAGYADPERPSSYAELLAAFDTHHAAFVAALENADPADEAWSWSQEQTVGFTFRRQAHEALIHRVDAEQTAGSPTPLDATLAADGVRECLDIMYGGCPDWGEFSPLPHFLRVDVTDTGDRIWVQLGQFHGTDPDDGIEHHEDDIHVVADPGVEPDASIEGTAEQLDLRLWRRGDGDAIRLHGDLKIVDHFRRAIHSPIE